MALRHDIPSALAWVRQQTRSFGLHTRGHFLVQPQHQLPPLADWPPNAASLLVLVGNVGSEFWPVFSASAHFQDGLPHPLDRWSKYLGDTMAKSCGGVAFYPFSGPPHHPFQRWAQQAEALGASPLGLRLHPLFGLWHAYRFALQIPVSAGEPGNELPEPAQTLAPDPSRLSEVCVQCTTKACLSACPVKAFTPKGYDVASCSSHLHAMQASGQPSACVYHTCQARSACPIGVAFAYTPEHGQFHMQQFMQAHHPGR